MQRPTWTFVKWCHKTCRYVKREFSEPLPSLTQKSLRIPRIDKLMYNPPDPRVPEFVKSLKDSPEVAKSLIVEWMPSLDHDTLEEFALLLARSKGIGALPLSVKRRLQRIGTYQYICSHSENRNRPNKEYQITRQPRPIDILALPLPECDATMKQNLLDSTVCYGPFFDDIQKSWQEQLYNTKSQRSPHRIVDMYLPFEEQCQIVSRELALVSAQISSCPFPRSLAQLCRSLGDTLEHAMLTRIAFQEGFPYVHRRSRYLWGVTGQARWTSKQRIALGAWWLEQALRHCRFTMIYQSRSVSRPAFWRTWYMSGSTKRGIFVLNQAFLKHLRTSSRNCEDFVTSSHIPQLIPPRPWTGLHATNVPLSARNLTLIASNGHSTEEQATIKEAIDSGAMQRHLDGLNRLGQQPWRINTKVLEVISKLGADLPSDKVKDGLPIQWQQAVRIAQALGTQTFYLPAYSDFRGRAYAFSGSALNHMGADPMRALFVFDKTRPLGEYGLQWLEMHLANMYGKCKSSTQKEKRHWVEINRRNIAQSARDPLHETWWKEGKKPFQILAACMELSKAWECDDPSNFESELPVQLDGTCNGLQHLVALAGDEENARHVNLVRNESCGDIYEEVARRVSVESEPINRCIVKDAVMTYFYGASLHGMQESLREYNVSAPFELATRIRSCLNEMLGTEREIQRWLLDCAQRISKARRADQPECMAAIAWTSPLGFPVVQPYVDFKLMAVRTSLQSFFLPSKFHQAPIIWHKQLAGVVANFIHSLDAAHMLATVCALPKEMSFAAVHDSFWTHASDAPQLGRVLREQFAALHRLDLLEGLREEWIERYRGFMVQGHVYIDSPLYDKVLWMRSGVCGGHKQQECLEKELKCWYEGKFVLSPDAEPVHWTGGVPFVGTPNRPSVKLWFPLEFAPSPPRGMLDIGAVMESPYFFS